MFYGIYTLIAMLLSSFAIINSNIIVIAFAQNISDANTFDLTIDDQTYPLMYNITGGEVSSITADRAQSTLLINIASREDGTLTIELPRNVIDSKAQGNTDEEYAVFVDDQPNNFEETTNNNEARVLEIGFDNGAEQIEIAGTQIIPEFGPISAIILAISIIGFIIAAINYIIFKYSIVRLIVYI